MALTFSVDGNPVPQPRPQVCVRNNKPHGYVKAKHPVHAYRLAIAAAARAAGAGVHGDPVTVELDFVWARPKSHLLKTCLRPTAPALPLPDIDNVAKAVLDALNGVAWEDDKQVRRLVVEKSYGPRGRTLVTIT